MTHSPSLTLSSVVRWHDTPVATEVDHEVVLLSMQRSRCYGLGDTGSAVWRKLEKPIAVAELCRQLTYEYSAEPNTLARDVLDLLEQLRSEGLVEVVG